MPARDSFEQSVLPLPGGVSLLSRIPLLGAARRGLRRVVRLGGEARGMVARRSACRILAPLILCCLPLLSLPGHAAGETLSGFRSIFHRPASKAKPSILPTPVATQAPYIQAMPLDGEEAHPAADASPTAHPSPTLAHPRRAPPPSRRGKPRGQARAHNILRGGRPSVTSPPAAATPVLPARILPSSTPLPPLATAHAGQQALAHQRLPLARRISPHPLAPPDLGLWRALSGWPGGLLAMAALALLLVWSQRRGKVLAPRLE